MARWEQDAVDFACHAWAFQWVGLFGRDPQRSGETVGKFSSTLTVARIVGAGTALQQNFPEVFFGDALVVSCVLKTMTDRQREIIWRHYVDRWYVLRPLKPAPGALVPAYEPYKLHRPVKQALVAKRMGVGVERYYELRDTAKRKIAPFVGEAPQSKVRDEDIGKSALCASVEKSH